MTISITNTLHFKFTLLCLIDADLMPSTYNLTIKLKVNNNTLTPHEIAKRINNIKLWINTCVDQSIAYSIHNRLDTSILEHLNNNIIMCPEDPYDHILLYLIQSKIYAIKDCNDINVIETCLTPDESDMSTTITGIPDILPSNKQWMGETSFFDKPWWERNDTSTVDIVFEPGDNLDEPPEVGSTFDNLIDLMQHKTILQSNAIASDSNTSAKTKSTFKPVIVVDNDPKTF